MCSIGDILCNLKPLAAYVIHENRGIGIIDMKHIPRDKETVYPIESVSLCDCFQLETEAVRVFLTPPPQLLCTLCTHGVQSADLRTNC